MLRKWEFQLPTQVRFGRGEAAKLGRFAAEFGKTALLVGYADQTGLETRYADATQSLEDAGLRVVAFHEVPPDPVAELGQQGAQLAKRESVDVVIGLGGGSTIDAAKGIAALVRMGGDLWDYTGANRDSRPITDSLPVIAVPTTAGTGTEVTSVAVFTHQGVGSMPEFPLKASAAGPAVRPKVALVDPDLTVGSPAHLTACCGADALGHALEACMSRRANPFSTALGTRAIALIVEHLPAAVADPSAPNPREPLALASTLAGAAFGMAGVTMTHSIAQALGGLLHIAHGEGVAIGTPINLRYNAEKCVDLYADLAHACRLGSGSPQEMASRFVDRVISMLQEVGLPDRVEVPTNVSGGGTLGQWAAKLARNAIEGTPVPIKLNPTKVDESTLTRLLEEILIDQSDS